jgi:signal transduction histidine kinase
MKGNKKNLGVTADALSCKIGRLIDAQDQERMRTAGELHNDIGPSLAIVGIDLLRAGQSASAPPGEKHPDVQQIYEKLQQIGSRISRLSNQLNPPMLKYFGLAKAIETECREFSEVHRIPVSFSCKNFSAKPDAIVALNIFRIMQEALRNAGKHSHATRIIVSVRTTATGLILEMSDDGVGFNAEQTNVAAGLGMISMRERMRLIGGEFEIRSRPGRGVKISCRAPLVHSGTAS